MMRDFLNAAAHMFEKASGSDGTRHYQSNTKRARHVESSSSSRGIIALPDGTWESFSQGIIALPNGTWEARVYVNDNWIPLGIFGTEMEAVIAYENTTVNNWIEGCKIYLQGINNGEIEPLSLQLASTDSTLPSPFVNIPQVQGERKCIQLFGKELARTDVGNNPKITNVEGTAGVSHADNDLGGAAAGSVKAAGKSLKLFGANIIV